MNKLPNALVRTLARVSDLCPVCNAARKHPESGFAKFWKAPQSICPFCRCREARETAKSGKQSSKDQQ